MDCQHKTVHVERLKADGVAQHLIEQYLQQMDGVKYTKTSEQVLKLYFRQPFFVEADRCKVCV